MSEKFTYTVSFRRVPESIRDADPILFAINDHLKHTLKTAGYSGVNVRLQEARVI